MFQHDFHGQHLPQVKRKLFLKNILGLKGRSYLRSRPIRWHGIARNKYYGAITKRMNFNYPVVETSDSIEPNDNDLNAIAYTFLRSSGQPEFKQLFARPH